MKTVFRSLTILMFICLYAVAGLFGVDQIGFGTALFMIIVSAAGVFGCAYLGGLLDEHKGE